MTKESNRRRLLAGICLVVLALLFATNPVTGVVLRGMSSSVTRIAMTGFIAPVQMALFIGAIVGITQLLRRRADRAGLAGAALALMGWAVGIRILALGQLESLLTLGVAGVPADTLDKMFTAAPIVWLSIVPLGLLFPIGLITLGIALCAAGPVNRWIGALLALGGILFPVGRAIRLEWALTACDLVLGASFALIGWQILTRRELWGSADAAPTSCIGDGVHG